MIVLLVAVLVVFGFGVGLIRLAWRQDRPRELSGGWWQRFEQQFRAYAERTGGAAPESTARRR